ncbi:Nucleotidyl transferase AbiEii toxin, Type IV TA system [compost metagenome]
MKADFPASVRARLLNVARAQRVDFNQVLVRFALERILYRLSRSAHADRFVLKGALLFTLWYDLPHRATRDADMLGFGASDLESLAKTFRDIAGIAVNDGIAFDPASVTTDEIRKEAGYAGARILITGTLANARCRTQISDSGMR